MGVTAGNGLASDLHPGAHRTRRPSTSLEHWRYYVVGRCSPRPGRDFSDIGALPFPKMHYVEPDWLFHRDAIRLVQCWPAAPLSQYMQTETPERKFSCPSMLDDKKQVTGSLAELVRSLHHGKTCASEKSRAVRTPAWSARIGKRLIYVFASLSSR